MCLISNTPMTDAQLKQVLSGFDYTTQENPLHGKRVADLFREQAKKSPDVIAVEMGSEKLTYAELDAYSDRVAATLIKSGVSANDIVAMQLSKSLSLAVGILGVTKSGGAFLPMDPSWPVERRQFIVTDAKCQHVVTQEQYEQEFAWFEGTLLPIDHNSWTNERATSNDHLVKSFMEKQSISTKPDDLAYVIFTSGSTGKPKGALVTHEGLLNYQWSVWTLGLKQPGWRCALSLNYVFDFFYYDFFATICFESGTLVLFETGLSLAELTEEDDIQTLSTIPSLLAALPKIPDSILVAIVAGEALTPGAFRAVSESKNAELWSMYGPTETSNLICARKVVDLDRLASLGSVFPNVSTHVVCPDTLQPRPIGEWGELLIGGVQVGKGYLNRPDLTSEKFISNPWGRGQLYRTGDLVRWLDNGELEIGGRIDFQIKFNGQRMEAGEIENALMDLDGVEEAVVVLRKDLDGPDALVGYVKPNSAVGQDQGAQLKEGLSLPKYMIPSIIVGIDEWPRNGNEKIDRKNLPKPATSNNTAHDDEANWEPRNDVDEQLRSVFAQVLKLGLSSVSSPSADFFDLGGDSLGSMRLVQAVHSHFGVKMPVAKVLRKRTLSAISDEISLLRSEENQAMPPVVAQHLVDNNSEDMEFPAHSGQSYILKQSFEYGAAGTSAYTCPMAVWVDGEIHIECLREAMVQMRMRHATLRTGFKKDPSNHSQYLQVVKGCNGSLADTFQRGVEVVDTERKALALYRDDCAIGFSGEDMLNGELVRSRLIYVEQTQRHLLLIQIHHIFFDGLSHQRFWHDFGTLYAKAVAASDVADSEILSATNNVPDLPPMPIQLVDLTRWQLETTDHPEIEKQRRYWKKQLREGQIPMLEFPEDKQRPNERTWNGWSIPLVIDPEVGKRLVAIGKEEKCTPFQVVLALWSLVLCRYTGQEEVMVGCAFGGRDQDVGLNSVMGFLVNYLAMRIEVPKDLSAGSIRSFLRSTRDTVTDGITNGQIPYNQVVQECLPRLNHDPARPQVFQSMLSMAGTDGWANHTEKAQFAAAGAHLTPIPQCTWDRCKSDVRIRAHQLSSGGFKGDIEYNSTVYSHERIEHLSRALVQLARSFAFADENESIWSLSVEKEADAFDVILNNKHKLQSISEDEEVGTGVKVEQPHRLASIPNARRRSLAARSA